MSDTDVLARRLIGICIRSHINYSALQLTQKDVSLLGGEGREINTERSQENKIRIDELDAHRFGPWDNWLLLESGIHL